MSKYPQEMFEQHSETLRRLLGQDIWADGNRREARNRRIAQGVGILALGALVMWAWPAPAAAQPSMPCHKTTVITAQLERQYGETLVAGGLQTNGNLLQVYASDEKGTWTVVSTTPDGTSCVVAAGKGGWQSLEALKGNIA